MIFASPAAPAFTRNVNVTVEGNFFAQVHVIQPALPLLESGNPGTIVNITSDAGVEAYSGWSGYGSSKAALEQLSRILAAEISGTNVRVLVADPGDMDTAMHRAALPDADPATLRNPRDVARALLNAVATMREPYERRTIQVDAHARA